MKKTTVIPIRTTITEVNHHSLKRNRRSTNVLHVSIGRPSNIGPIHNQSTNHYNTSHPIHTVIGSHDQQQQQNDHKNLSINRIQQRKHSSSKNDIHDNHSSISQTRKASLVRPKSTPDYHQDLKRNKKKKCTRQDIIRIVVPLLVMIITVVVTMLFIILIQRKSTTTSTPVLRWNTTGITVAGITGVLGNTPDQLNAPSSITLDYSNTLYIVDLNNARVQKFLRDASTGVTVAGNGSTGTSQSELNGPSSILVDTNSNIYVADTGNNRVQLWANGATSGTTLAGSASGVGGAASSMLSGPSDVALDSNTGTLYIADNNNYRIMSYASNAAFGVVVAGGNGSGLDNTQLNHPVACHFDSESNSLIIVNIDSNNIVRWVLSASYWIPVAGDTNASGGNTSTLFRSPSDLTLDPMGNLYVVDRDNHRIQFFFVDQSNGTTIAGVTEISGNDSTLLNIPQGIALDNQLNLYVADTGNQRIQKFQRY